MLHRSPAQAIYSEPAPCRGLSNLSCNGASKSPLSVSYCWCCSCCRLLGAAPPLCGSDLLPPRVALSALFASISPSCSTCSSSATNCRKAAIDHSEPPAVVACRRTQASAHARRRSMTAPGSWPGGAASNHCSSSGSDASISPASATSALKCEDRFCTVHLTASGSNCDPPVHEKQR